MSNPTQDSKTYKWNPPTEQVPTINEQSEAFILWREGKEVEYWDECDATWRSLQSDCSISNKYLLRKKVEQPKPKERELVPIDWIRPGFVVRKGDAPMTEYLITEVHRERSAIMIGQSTYSTLSALAKDGCEYNEDPTKFEWSSFYKD